MAGATDPEKWGKLPIGWRFIPSIKPSKQYIKQHRPQYNKIIANEMQTETSRVIIAIPLFANHKSAAFTCYTSRHANQCAYWFFFSFCHCYQAEPQKYCFLLNK